MTQFHTAKSLVKHQRYSDAVEYLGKLLKLPEDCLIPKEENGLSYRGLKSAVVELIGQMPQTGRQLYDMFCGRDAKQMLDDALATGDTNKLARVAARYFHTEAGYDATFLLGLNYLDHGAPLAAALTLRKLAEFPDAADRFEPALTLALASAWLQVGDARQSPRCPA